MITVELNGNEVKIPNSWTEITFKQFLNFYNLTKTFKSKEDLEEEFKDKGDTKDLYMSLDSLKCNTKMVSFWTGVSEDEIAMCDLDEVADILKELTFLNQSYTPLHIDSFVFKGDKYILPEVGMAKSTFGDYIQSEQLELNNVHLENGRIEVMPEQVAILCKKEGEKGNLDDDEIDKRKVLFEELDMATIWDVGFFLTRHESLLMTSFLISQKDQMINLQKSQPKEQ